MFAVLRCSSAARVLMLQSTDGIDDSLDSTLSTVDRLLAHMLITHARTHTLALSCVLTVETNWL